MDSKEKIFAVLKRIKGKVEISPDGATLDYRAGEEIDELSTQDEIMILNKLEEDGIIEVVQNYASDYI